MDFATLRSIAILAQFILICSWGHDPIADMTTFSSDWILLHIGFLLLCCVLFCAGVLTSTVFTLMMHLSQTAPEEIKGTHYTTLATFEVLGKLSFAAICGYLIDTFGMDNLYLLFVLLAFLTIPFIMNAPRVIINSHNKADHDS